MKYSRFRIITNLHCNQACYFCYQPLKEELILPLDKLKSVLSKCQHMPRATIMGGESTLLPNLPEYVAAVKEKADVVCLVTNGSLLDVDLLVKLRNAGLDEIAISVHSIEQYIERYLQIMMAHLLIPNCRVNLPKSHESVGMHLYMLVATILTDGFGVVVCEDLMGRYGEFDFEGGMGAKLVRTDGHNFLTYEWRGYEFGLFAHYEGYNNTDIIITPVGNFTDWQKYCEKVGNHGLR